MEPFPEGGLGVAWQPSQWELVGGVSLAQGSLCSHTTAPIAPTSAPAPCFCLRRQPYVTTSKPSATLPRPGPPFLLPFPTCVHTFLLSLFRSDFSYSFLSPRRNLASHCIGARILHLVPVLTDGSNIACFDCLAQLIFGGMG